MTTDADRSARRVPRRTALAVALTAALVAPLAGWQTGAAAATPGHARTATETAFAAAVLTELNHERAVNHLPALRMNPQLLVAARTHNAAMAKAQLLSHQLRGEADFTKRISAAGYRWRSIAENIGVSAPPTKAAVLAVQVAMYREKAPNDPHRRNILGKAYADVGIDVYLDPAHRRVWVTQDFGHH